MKRRMRTVLATLVVAFAVLGAGATTALARSGGSALHSTNGAAVVSEAAKQLGVTTAVLQKAIVDSAEARIDAAVEDEDLTSAEGDDAKAEVETSLRYAMAASQTRTVASNLGVTTAKLNAAFRAARKTILLARIDAAVASGDLAADQAATLKTQLDSLTLPGYRLGGLADLASGRGAGAGRDGPGGCGHGAGGSQGSSGSSSGSSGGDSSGSSTT